MKDFNDFKPKSKENLSLNGDAMSKFTELASKFEGKSSDELISAIIAEAEKGRRNGTLSDKDIDDFARTISPMLTDIQKKALNGIVKKIKKI
ncbi:MAG: hypothetical protein IJ706_09340 [Clostridia bacterium]|nr:hypothetical protein [Clostridia bacterium]MBR1677495.1 hypothetical protein [Clostridia bacterium]